MNNASCAFLHVKSQHTITVEASFTLELEIVNISPVRPGTQGFSCCTGQDVYETCFPHFPISHNCLFIQ